MAQVKPLACNVADLNCAEADKPTNRHIKNKSFFICIFFIVFWSDIIHHKNFHRSWYKLLEIFYGSFHVIHLVIDKIAADTEWYQQRCRRPLFYALQQPVVVQVVASFKD
jgi:hypothetical protein